MPGAVLYLEEERQASALVLPGHVMTFPFLGGWEGAGFHFPLCISLGGATTTCLPARAATCSTACTWRMGTGIDIPHCLYFLTTYLLLGDPFCTIPTTCTMEWEWKGSGRQWNIHYAFCHFYHHTQRMGGQEEEQEGGSGRCTACSCLSAPTCSSHCYFLLEPSGSLEGGKRESMSDPYPI